MEQNVLNLNYYYTKDHNRDEFAFALNCFHAPIYFITRNILNEYISMSELILSDISLAITERSGKLYDINYLGTGSNRINEAIKLDIQIPLKNEENEMLEHLLDNNKKVIVQTASELLAFDHFYNPNFEAEKFTPVHYMLVVSHDAEYYYFVENLDNINIQYFTSYEKNNEIGKIKKEEFVKALKCYAKYYTYSNIKEDNIHIIKNNTLTIIRQMIYNYFREASRTESDITFYGKEAIKYLIDICNSDKIQLNTRLESAPQKVPRQVGSQEELSFYIEVTLQELIHRLIYFIDYFVHNPEIETEIRNNTIKYATLLKANWEKIKNYVIRKNTSQDYYLDLKMKYFLIESQELNDSLMNQLSAIFNHNYHF